MYSHVCDQTGGVVARVAALVYHNRKRDDSTNTLLAHDNFVENI